MDDYPSAFVPVGHVEPVPRRIRATLAGKTVLDTNAARYVWEWPYFPQYYIPVEDVDAGVLVDRGRRDSVSQGNAKLYDLEVDGVVRPDAVKRFEQDAWEGLSGLLHFSWAALEHWFEEDEEVYVHPRSPYSRVDAIRSTRRVTIELAGVPLAESSSPVLVFETGLPTRYYLNPTEVDFSCLEPSATTTQCPYKGRTTGYWTAHLGGETYRDIAWTYAFPTRQLAPIAGLIAFYNERVDLSVDGERLDRPRTHLTS